jgi:hypothetical protein
VGEDAVRSQLWLCFFFFRGRLTRVDDGD